MSRASSAMGPDPSRRDVTSQTETERKFVRLPGASEPDLSGLAVIGEAETSQLDATYFDSPDFALNRSRITLRRRTGGGDAGWHLKLPAGAGDRREYQVELDASPDEVMVPAQLRDIVNDQVGFVPLVPVARLQTTRRQQILSSPSGAEIAELAEDTVTATRHGLPRVAASSSTWDEWEVELLPGGTRQVLEDITERFSRAGIVQAASPSKVTQALGDAPQAAAEHVLGPDSPLVEVVLAACGVQIGVIQARAEQVRLDAPSAVHKTRVATRRLRSILRVFRNLFDREAVGALREELKWYATELGHARDAEVQQEALLHQFDHLPPEAVVGPVAQRLESELGATHREALQVARAALDSERFVALQRALAQFLASPPLREGAPEKVTWQQAPAMIGKAIARVRREEAIAEQCEGVEQWEALHEVRKKAKVVRYACEAMEPAYGAPAAEAALAWSQVTEVFGHMNDMAVSRERLARLAEVAASHGEPTFTYGVMFGTQMGSFASALPAAQAALARAVRRDPGTWLDELDDLDE